MLARYSEAAFLPPAPAPQPGDSPFLRFLPSSQPPALLDSLALLPLASSCPGAAAARRLSRLLRRLERDDDDSGGGCQVVDVRMLQLSKDPAALQLVLDTWRQAANLATHR